MITERAISTKYIKLRSSATNLLRTLLVCTDILRWVEDWREERRKGGVQTWQLIGLECRFLPELSHIRLYQIHELRIREIVEVEAL